MTLVRVGAETLLKVYGVTVDPDEFRAFAGMGEAYFLSGVAGKYGIQVDDIDKLKEVFYGIYLEKAADPTEDIGLPGEADSWCMPKLRTLKSCMPVMHAHSICH